MIVKSHDDLLLANKMRRLITVGASATDLQSIFKDYFWQSTQVNASAKASRVYKDLKPEKLRVSPSRTASINSFLRTKSTRAAASDFLKTLYPLLKNAGDTDDLINTIFINAYESWLDNWDNNGSPQLNFQMAYALFRYATTKLNCPYSPMKPTCCKNCQHDYFIFDTLPRKQQNCPYC
jgi:hypothetical protein